MKTLNLNRRSKWLLCAFVVLLVVPWLWNRFYYAGPKAAYYELAHAIESQDTQKLKQLVEPYILAELPLVTKNNGGMRKFGQDMQKAPDVNVAIHMVGTVDLFATIDNRPCLIQFSVIDWRWKVVMAQW